MITSARWSTASFGEAPNSSPVELSDLQEHVHVCQGLRGRWFDTRCRAEAVHGFMVARFVTTVVLICVLAIMLVWVA